MENFTTYDEHVFHRENPDNESEFSFDDFFVNATEDLIANATAAAPPQVDKGVFILAFKVVYGIGIAGNIGAMMFLWLGKRRLRNRKHLLLLTALAVNDLVALVGMLSALLVTAGPGARVTQGLCAARVVLRVFGIGSVCIAVTMAMERYLALTRPFFYHKCVTYNVIRNTLLATWGTAAVLTCAPLAGVGAYWDGKDHRCLRYKNVVASDGLNFGYAVVYVGFGALLCLILVFCNCAVILALSALSPRAGAPVTRSVSRKSRPKAVVFSSCSAATAEEVQFSWLMASLSVLFMGCWMPQIITSLLFLTKEPEQWRALERPAMYADLLMMFNYVLNPLIYVLMRRRSSLKKVWRAIAGCCKRQHHKTSTGSTKTSGCLHDTLLTSESSAGSELRPLRSRILVTPAAPPPLPF